MVLMEQEVPLVARPAKHGISWMAARRGWFWQGAPGILVALIGLALRLALIWRYPLLYDGDAYGRWLDRDHPFDSPWVPLFQVCIYLLTRLADSILAVRLLSAFFGATAALCFWLLLRRAFGPAAAYLGALLLALNPLFVLFSIVPYQEGLFFTLAFLALWLALAVGAARWRWLALVVGLAALTRYEGWLLAVLLWLLFLWRRRRAGALTWRFAAGSALALGWAPLLWVLVNRNVGPYGAQTLAPTLDPASLPATLGALWPEWSLHLGLIGGLLALAGLGWMGWRAARGSELAWLLLGFLLGDLLILAFLRPFSPNNLRLPLLSLPVLLAGMAGLAGDAAIKIAAMGLRPAHRLEPTRRFILGSSILVTIGLLVWLVPVSVQRAAGYDTLVRPAYLAADDLPRTLPSDATIALVGSGRDFFAFLVYARQAGWQGTPIALMPTATNTPALLEAALAAAHAQLLVIYGPAASSAAVLALTQEGWLVPAGQGSGYALWLVEARHTRAPGHWVPFMYAEGPDRGEQHIIWRPIGGHDILNYL